MNGVHDMGGMQCFGPVVEEKDERVFHEAWERRAFGLTLAMGTSGLWNIDKARALREAMPPHKYLAWSYYQLWFEGLVGLLVDAGAIDAKELMDDAGPQTPKLPTRKLNSSNVEPMFMKGWPSHRHVAEPARFATGDRVTTVTDSMPGHTRLPRYCSGKQGTVIAVRGAHVFPDTNAKLAGEHPKWLYTVRFEAKDLFGATTTADAVNVDCFEPYLASAPEA